MGAGSGHSVKAKPCRAASRALTFMPWLTALYTRGRRTRKPPAGARSKETRRSEAQRQRHKKAFPASRSFPTYRHGGHDTCKSVPAYAPQSFPDTYGVASRPEFRCPCRHARYADLALRRILTTRFAHSVQAFAVYRLLICRMLARHCRHAHQRHAGYTPAAFPIPASCVHAFAQMPVYSSGLVSEGQPTFRLYAVRIASRLARGHAPLNPGKPKDRENGERIHEVKKRILISKKSLTIILTSTMI